MPLFSKLSSFCRNLFHKTQIEHDLDEEARSYLEMLTQENIKTGKSPEEALRAALIQFGGIDQVKEQVRDVRVGVFLESIWLDLRNAACILAKSPGFTAVAVLTLALGIGGTTAIFSVIQCAVLDLFPYVDSDRLVMLVADKWCFVSGSEFLDYREQNHVFDEVIGGAPENLVLTGTDTPENFYGLRVTGNLLRVLGVPPLIGRPITPEDCKSGTPAVVVLSYKTWQSKFGGDLGIVGKTLVLNRQPTTVIGVMPSQFRWQGGANMFLPANLPRGGALDYPGQLPYFSVVGHLKPGVSMDQVRSEVAILVKRMSAVYPKDHPAAVTVRLERLADADPDIVVIRKTLHILLGAVSLLLFIGCVNVANLLLARATAREQEIAIRASLGASRSRLVRQFMIESLLLALVGAVLGCWLAWNGQAALVAIMPPWMIPSDAVIRLNSTVLLFALGAAILSTLLFGLAPALLAARKDLQAPLKATGRGAGESNHRLRNLLVVGEVALSLILLTGAGLLIRSFFELRHVDLGYDPDNVVLTSTELPEDRYKTVEQRNQFHMESLRRVRALPFVVSAALGAPQMDWGVSAPIEITSKPSAEKRSVWIRFASDGFLETMGIRLLRGRVISEKDFVQAQRVAVVNRTFVTRYFGKENPLGRQIKVMECHWWPPTMKQKSFEIIGEVADTRSRDFGRRVPIVRPTIVVPFSIGGLLANGLAVRTTADPTHLLNPILREFATLDNELPVSGRVWRDHLSRSWFAEPRFVLEMMVAFASLGLTLVSVGVYSVLSYGVSRRTQEIGIRMALGAEANDVRRMVMMSGLRWLLVGIGVGVPASIALAKVLQNRIWGIKSADPLTLIAVSLVLTAVGLIACYFPARRATSVDPMIALRYE